MNRLLHLRCQGVRVGSRHCGDVELVVGGVGAHRLELVGGGVDGSDSRQLGVGSGRDDADDRGRTARGVGLLIGVVRGQADRVADAQTLLLGELRADGDLPGGGGQASAAQGGELAEGRNVLRADGDVGSVAQLLGQVEVQDVPVDASYGGDAVEPGDLVEEGIVQIAPGGMAAPGPLDDDARVTHGQACAGLHLGAEGVGDDEGEGDEGGAHGHGHEGGGGAPNVEQ